MPYSLVKVKGGYKVGLTSKAKMSNGRYYLSNKPMSRARAEAQKKAVESQEQKPKKRSNPKRKKKKINY